MNNDIINNTISSTNASQQTDLPCPVSVTSSKDTHKLYFQTMSSLCDDQTPKFKDSGSKLNKNVQIASHDENDIASQMESEDKCTIDGNSYEISKGQHEQCDNFSDYSNSEHENDEYKNRNYHLMKTIKNSQDLHTRFV